MKKVHWFGVVALLTLAIGCYWWIKATPAPSEQAIVPASPTQAPDFPQAQNVSPPPAVRVKEEQTVALSEQFSFVAKAYAEELNYPAYSQPLTLAMTQTAEFIPQQLPLEGGGAVSLAPDKYRFSQPELITAELIATNITLNDVSVSLRNEWTGQQLWQQGLQPQDGRWLIQIKPAKNWDGQLELAVTFHARGEQQTLRTGIEYSQPVAWILAVDDSYGEGADLVLPLQMDILEAGDYRIRAHLLNQTGEPLAALVQEKRLDRGKQTFELRAFKAVLQQAKGDLRLTAFVVEKRPSKPGDLTRYGASKQSDFLIPAFDIGQLSDEPAAISEEEQQRLEFLQKMGSQ